MVILVISFSFLTRCVLLPESITFNSAAAAAALAATALMCLVSALWFSERSDRIQIHAIIAYVLCRLFQQFSVLYILYECSISTCSINLNVYNGIVECLLFYSYSSHLLFLHFPFSQTEYMRYIMRANIHWYNSSYDNPSQTNTHWRRRRRSRRKYKTKRNKRIPGWTVALWVSVRQFGRVWVRERFVISCRY